MSKFTPGPWTPNFKFQSEDFWQIDTGIGNPKIFMTRFVDDNGTSWDESEANVHLVAAAPELLQVAKNFIDSWHGFEGDLPTKIKEYLIHAIEIIAKAEGKS